MNFVADEMLGKLARWMRFMGLDVVHRSPFPDEELIEAARYEGRIILTRDGKIIEHPSVTTDLNTAADSGKIPVIPVTHDLPFDQMADLVDVLHIDPMEKAFTRCALCNAPLVGRTKSEVAGRVPPFVFANVEEYNECTGCGRIYWAGTHRARIERILREIAKKSSGSS